MWRLRVMWLVLVVLATCAIPQTVLGGGPDDVVYVVQPGDALPALAQQFGLSLRALMRLNGIRHPLDLYPGQHLSLGEDWRGHAGYAYTLTDGMDFASTCRAVGLRPADVAVRNQLLLPTGLRVGQTIWLPARGPDVTSRHVSGYAATIPRLAAAVASGRGWWEVLGVNPVPVPRGGPVLLPGSATVDVGGGSASLVTGLTISAQPVVQGQTVAFRLETSDAVTCVVSAFGAESPCLPGDEEGREWGGLVPLSPLLETGAHTVTLLLEAVATSALEHVSVPILVSAGRYDFERLDLPSDRQALLDPTLSQAERNKIATLRLLHTPERLWQYPFVRPVESHVSSYFGSRRSYGYGFTSFHAGTDFDGQVGMAVVAPADGVVVLAEPLVVRGNALLIDHGQGIVTGFWHLSRFDVTVGERVSAGQTVAALGNTGLSTGPHLHWELWVNGAPVDPLAWLQSSGPPAMLQELAP